MQTPLTKESSVTTGGLTLSTANSRAVTLTDPNNPLSLSSLTDTFTINSQTSTMAYNAATRTFTATSPMGRQLAFTTNAQGSITGSQIPGLGPTSYSYDTHGRLSTITAGSGGTQRQTGMGYNTGGYLESITNPLSQTTQFIYDLAGRVTRQTFPDSRQVQYDYDGHGNLTSLITPRGNTYTHTFEYSPVDLTASYTAPGSTTTSYTYNNDRQLTRITRPEGTFMDFGYDASGRLQTITLPDGGGQISRTYNGTTGQLSTITTANGGTLTFGYGGALLTSEAWGGLVAGTVSRTYDNNFRLSSRSINGGSTIGYLYDNDGLLVGAGNLTLTRNTLNGLLTGTTLGSVTDAWIYNGFAEPTGYTAYYGASPLFNVQYAYDNLGRINQKTETIGAVTDIYQYEYDLAGRLQNVIKNGSTISTYTYDANGNRDPGTYDDQDRMLTYGSNTYTYTANGELNTKTTAGQTTTYQYDALGNLLNVVLPDATQIQYLVDGLDRRIGKQVNGTQVKGFLFSDQLHPVAELDGSNNPVSIFVYGSRGNVPEYMVKGGVTYRIISDHLGSPRLVVDTSKGAIAQRMDYDEFGRVLTDTNPGFQPFGFAGGLYDPDTGLVRFGARDYDAETGRWTAKDPILFEGKDLNLYGYVGNDPVNLSDPPGLGPSIGLGSALSIVHKNKIYLPRFSPSGQQVGIRIIQRIRPGVWVRPGPPGIYTEGLLDSAKTYPLRYSSPTLTRLGWVGKALGYGGKALGYVGLALSYREMLEGAVPALMEQGYTEAEARMLILENTDPCP
jgi:RHS repeat-associated protein